MNYFALASDIVRRVHHSPDSSANLEIVVAGLIRKEQERDVILASPPECPWPESVWPMTEQQYCEAVPDEAMRTAISGFLMRLGWNEAMRQVKQAQITAPET